MMYGAFDAKEVFNVIVNPVFEYFRHALVESRVKHFLNCEVEDWGVQDKTLTRGPATFNRLCLRLSPRNQFQSILMYWQGPGGEAWCGMIDKNPGVGFLQDADEDRKR